MLQAITERIENKVLEEVSDLEWIRLLYAYPMGVSDRLIEFFER